MKRSDPVIVIVLLAIFLLENRARSTEIDYASSTTTVAVTHLLPPSNSSSHSPKSPGNEIPIPTVFNQSILSYENVTYPESFVPTDLLTAAPRKYGSDNETDGWTQVTSIYSRITTEYNPLGILLSPKLEKRGDMSMMKMMKMMKATNKMNTMMNMMNAMMKFKSKY